MSKLERCFKCFLISRKSFFIAFGGVLSVLALALIPSNCFAYDMGFTSRDSSFSGYFESDVYGACKFQAKDVLWHGDYAVPSSYLGATIGSSTSNCNYSVSNNTGEILPNGTGRVGYYRSPVSSGVLTNSTSFHTVGNSDPAWWSRQYMLDQGRWFRSVNKHISLNIGYVNNYHSALNVPLRSISNQKTFFFLRLETNGSFDVSNTVSIRDSSISIFDNNGRAITGDDYTFLKNVFIQNTDLTILKVCGDATSYFPSISNWDFANNTNSCYIIGSFYNNENYTYHIGELKFSPAKTSYYNLVDLSTNQQLTDDYYTDWIMYNAETYEQLASNGNSYTNGMWYNNYYFYSATCSSASECEAWTEVESHNIGVINGNNPNWTPSDDAGSSAYMWWFNVFNFGFTFPFRNFFEAFTDSTNCVDVPIIGGMLHNPNARYCSWWSSDVRSVLTPVFSLAGLMILTGLIMHWLKGYNGIETTKTKRSEK